MQTTTVAAERTVERAPHEVFTLFGTAPGAGWVFGARCDEVSPGAPVSLRLPLDEHGRLNLRLTPAGSHGTRVQVRAHVPTEGVEWLLHRRGIPLPEPPDDGAVRLGVIATSSGPGAVYSLSAELMAELAVSEVNADGGVAGRPVQLITADDATDATQAAMEAERLARLGCRAVFVPGSTSPRRARRACRSSARPHRRAERPEPFGAGRGPGFSTRHPNATCGWVGDH